MIPLGQKVTVLASSVNKSGANIRRGSQGYISMIGKVTTVHSINVAVSSASVVFTRFGFEKKIRCETKPVLMVTPIDNIRNIKNVQRYLNKLTKRTADSSDMILRMLNIRGRKKLPVVVVFPTQCDISSDINEHRCWFLSVLRSGVIWRHLSAINGNPMKAPLDKLCSVMPGMDKVLKSSISNVNSGIRLADTVFNSGITRGVHAPLVRMMRSDIHLEIMFDASITNRAYNIGDRRAPHLNRHNVIWFLKLNNLRSDNDRLNKIVERDENVDKWLSALRKICKESQ